MKVSAQTVSCLDFTKYQGLLPVTVQHPESGQILMQAYMNEAAVRETLRKGQVTFYSRSKQRLWTKGESSGHFLQLAGMYMDCDQDAILVHALPAGPTCHLGTTSCFDSAAIPTVAEIALLEATIQERQQALQQGEGGDSYTASLLAKGVHKCAQKTGEEGVEVALAAVNEDDTALLNESADLLYHLLVTLRSRNLDLKQVVDVLRERRQ